MLFLEVVFLETETCIFNLSTVLNFSQPATPTCHFLSVDCLSLTHTISMVLESVYSCICSLTEHQDRAGRGYQVSSKAWIERELAPSTTRNDKVMQSLRPTWDHAVPVEREVPCKDEARRVLQSSPEWFWSARSEQVGLCVQKVQPKSLS